MARKVAVERSRYYKQLKALLNAAQNKEGLYEAIVNAPFRDRLKATEIDLGILVLLMVNSKTKNIDRIALSDTEHAEGAVNMSAKPFKAIKIPMDDEDNIIAKAIRSGQPQMTTDWKYLFVPAMTARQARFNQAGAGIECSIVYPLRGLKHGGAMIFSFFQPPENFTNEHKAFADAYSKLVADKLKDSAHRWGVKSTLRKLRQTIKG